MSRSISGLLAALTVGFLLTACASVPPPEGEMEKADLAFRNAEVAQGTQYAPLETRLAREKLEKARAAMRNGDNLEARRLAEEAKVDAVLAETKSHTAQRQTAAEEIQRDIDAIREEAARTQSMMKGATQ